jgi:hypothetical protein
MKVFISVDMEGISGLVRWADVASQGIDYQRNRSIMTKERTPRSPVHSTPVPRPSSSRRTTASKTSAT